MTDGTPMFHLQIVSVGSGAVACIPGGGRLETDLVNLFTHYIVAEGVSWKSQKHVEADIRQGVYKAIMAMKDQTKYLSNIPR